MNVLRYDTPNLDGWTGSLSYATGETRGASGSPSAWQIRIRLQKASWWPIWRICTPMTATAA